jgi:hypothetical protein
MAERPGITRPGSSAMTSRADRRRQIVAFGAISGLMVVAFGLWAVAILTSGDERQLEIAAEPPSAPEPAEESDDQDVSSAAGRDDTEPDSDPDTEPVSEPADAELATVTIDEVCTVEVPVAERDAAPLRAWEYPDCAYAPVPVEERRERWIVVRASMGAGDFDARAAEERAQDLGVDGGVLWSSHYPSLNPDLWVVYEGPFPDAEAARQAAESVDGEAYARALTTDDDDRFCIATDGCVGERTD